ncbi:sulfatase-like hydrolase/transferase [Halomarina pelagica]|uniref:sulfatase-like hydrolase/transferase n=1 Tax=Halomarina pelagica TaxID=2961599 RepID=UPI0020C59BCD|nr:sulfatase-like hydrolase/transferase [Halomarina sp. BND7]
MRPEFGPWPGRTSAALSRATAGVRLAGGELRDVVPDGVKVVPDGAIDRAAGIWTALGNRRRERRADRRFAARERPEREPAPDAPQHVVCVVVDALRADALDGDGTPFLSGLSGGDAISTSTWTFPAIASLMSGRYPHDHGAMRRSDSFADSVEDVTGLPEPIPDDEPLLSDALAGAGYRTYGAFGFVVPFLALRGRFETHALYEDAPAARLLADHAAWLADHREERTFSYLHLADCHEPVDPPAGYWEAHGVADLPGIRGWRHEDVVEPTPTVERFRRHRRRLYDAAVEYVDNRLSAHHNRVSDLAGGDVALAVVGDHGEGFWERAAFHAEHFADPRPAHCVGHGGAPYEAVVRVPVRTAGLGVARADADGCGNERERLTSLLDAAPTIAEVVGVDLPDAPDAVPLGRSIPDERVVLVEGVRYGYEKKAAYVRGGEQTWKRLVSRGDDVDTTIELPGAVHRPPPEAIGRRLRDALPSWPGENRTRPGRTDGELSSDLERRLDRLGYR